MGIGLTGLLVTAVGVILVAAGYFFFEFSLWLMIPGGALLITGLSLINGAQEQLRLRITHRVSNSYDDSVGSNSERSRKE